MKTSCDGFVPSSAVPSGKSLQVFACRKSESQCKSGQIPHRQERTSEYPEHRCSGCHCYQLCCSNNHFLIMALFKPTKEELVDFSRLTYQRGRFLSGLTAWFSSQENIHLWLELKNHSLSSMLFSHSCQSVYWIPNENHLCSWTSLSGGEKKRLLFLSQRDTKRDYHRKSRAALEGELALRWKPEAPWANCLQGPWQPGRRETRRATKPPREQKKLCHPSAPRGPGEFCELLPVAVRLICIWVWTSMKTWIELLTQEGNTARFHRMRFQQGVWFYGAAVKYLIGFQFIKHFQNMLSPFKLRGHYHVYL